MTAPHIARAACALAVTTTLAAAQSFTVPRALPGDLDLVRPGGRALEMDVAAGAGGHLAVWVDGRSGLGHVASVGGHSVWGKEDVIGRLLDAAGEPVGEPFLVGRMPFEARRPRVAWNGVDAWLVVWEGRRATLTTTYVGIRGVRVAADGARLDATPLVIDDTHGVDERFAGIAGQGGEWMVAWNDVDLVASEGGVRAAIVAGDGSVQAKRMLGQASPGFVAPSYPDIAAAGGRYLVTWEHYGSAGPGWNVYGRLFDGALAPLGAEFPIGWSGGETKARCASNGAEFLVTWNGSRVARVSTAGVVTPPDGRPLAIAAANAANHAPPAWNQDRWVVAGTNLSGDVLVEEIDAQGATLASGAVHARPGRTQDPAVSAFGGRAVVAWCEDVLEHADAASTWVEAGLVAGPVHEVGAAPPFQIEPDVDGDSQRGYFVAWLDSNSGTHRIMAQRLTGEGLPLDPQPVLVHEGSSFEVRAPRVARGATEALVVWENRGQTVHRIQGKRLSPAGAVLDATPLDLLPGNTPDVDFESGTYLVVATHEPTNHFRPVIATRVSPAGAVLDSPHLTIGSSYSRSPRVASTGGRFLSAWSRYASHDSPHAFTQANFVDPNGVVGTPFAVESASGSTYAAGVAGGNGEFLVTYAYDSDVWGRAVTAAGVLLGPPAGVHLTYAPGGQGGSTAVQHGGGWLTAWTDYRIHPVLEAGIGDVWGSRLDASEALVDFDGLPIATGSWVEGDVELAGDGSSAVAVLSAWSEAHQALRIHVSRLASDSIGARYCSPSASNSTGSFASVHARGSDRAFDNDVTLRLEGAPPTALGYFLASETQALSAQPGGSQGTLCLGGTVARFAAHVFQVDAGGAASFSPDLTALPLGPGIPAFPGETWNFQAWFRDANPGPTSNFSDAVELQLR